MAVTTTTLRPGADKPNPFTICIAANPVLQKVDGTYGPDPIIGQYETFKASVSYIDAALFCLMPAQRENLLADPAIEPNVRLVAVYDDGLSVDALNCLVAEDEESSTLLARRSVYAAWLARYGYTADVVFAVSSSCTHALASAWFTSDDDEGPGMPFDLDGATLYHRLYNLIPGTVAIHQTASSVTALHEFSHAISSYTNGKIIDLYEDGGVALNNRLRRPRPANFCRYNGRLYTTDTTRGGLGYPPAWFSYHSELVDTTCPALMDNYWQSSVGPDACRHDALTAQFIRDRVLAKMTR